MALNGLFRVDVPLRNYSHTPLASIFFGYLLCNMLYNKLWTNPQQVVRHKTVSNR